MTERPERQAGDAPPDREPKRENAAALRRASGPLAPLALRDFRLLWLAQFGTTMGLWMDQAARAWLIYSLTNSAVDLGLVSAARALPTLAFGIVAGVVADRYERKLQLVVAQVGNLGLNILLAVLVTTGLVEPWHVYVTSILAGVVQSFQQPARQAMISDLVDRSLLIRAVALNSAVFNLSRTLGPALAGGLIVVIGMDGAYYVQAAMYLFATIWTLQMRVPPVKPQVDASGNRASFGADLVEGMRYIAVTPLMRTLTLFSLAPTLIAMPYVSLMPIFARDVLAIGAEGQGLLLAASGVGAFGGAMWLTVWGNLRYKGWLLIASSGSFGLFLMGFANSTWAPLSLLLLFCAGWANTTYGSTDQTVVQLQTPSHLRGRVLSIYMMNRGLSPLGGLAGGLIAAWLGGPAAVTIMGLTTCLIVAGFAWQSRLMRELTA